MPGYVAAALHKFHHIKPGQHHSAPSRYLPPNYGANAQYVKVDTTDPMTKDQTLTLQQVVGTFLYYARAVDSTMLHAFTTPASEQAAGTQNTVTAMVEFMNYCASNPAAILRYGASGMVLHTHSDAGYLTDLKARSRAGGHHYMGNRIESPNPIHNGAVLDISKILRMVVAPAAEAKVGALFYNWQDAAGLRTIAIEMGHPQPATPVCTDNSTADGIINSMVKQNRSKAIDMRFYWVRDRSEQNQFKIYWAPGKVNLADYQTKHHPGHHHQTMIPYFLHEPKTPINQSFLGGCVDPSPSLVVTQKLIQRPSSGRWQKHPTQQHRRRQ
jgi:hypothetical protein